MSTKKAGGSSKNLSDSQPKYLGIKLYAGEKAKPGSIIVRQRGTRIMAGKNVRVATDHTLYAMKEGLVEFGHTRKVGFNGKTQVKKTVSVK